ncbi:MAG: NTP transferase domain-containing protein [Limnochordaceae bacterium]|nr:NTP transferase domain-containing protein [Limnochordaceae bacterium]
MAGGQGSRLRPLTCDRPKPMVPVLNQPIMAHIVRLLQQSGVGEIVTTLHPMPEQVADHFGRGETWGVTMHHLVEDRPMGTAGSVARARGLLDGTVVIISGDALTDLDVAPVVEFHRRRGAAATLVLKAVEDPSEYGMVITAEDGRVLRFLEKPARGQVFSDQVNTGIYVLEADVLSRVPPDRPFDFSRDLFPLLLASGQPLYGYLTGAYWSDVGNPEQYRQAHLDALRGQVQLPAAAEWLGYEVEPGVWVGEQARVAPGARLAAPCVVGPGCDVEDGAEVGPFASLGSGCWVGRGASIRHSVLWKGCRVGPGAEVRGAVLADGVVVGRRARIFEGAVVGHGTRVGESAVVSTGVRLWPDKQVPPHRHVSRSVVWAGTVSRAVVGVRGVEGLPGVELTPEMAAGVAGAFASLLAPESTVAVADAGGRAARALAAAAAAGAASAGLRVVWLGPAASPEVRALLAGGEDEGPGGMQLAGALYVDQDDGEAGEAPARLRMWDASGRDPAPERARAVDQAFRRDEWRRVGPEAMGPIGPYEGPRRRARERYVESVARRVREVLLALDDAGRSTGGALRPADAEPPLVGVAGPSSPGRDLLVAALQACGMEPVAVPVPGGGRKGTPGVVAAARVSPSGERVELWERDGRPVAESVVHALWALWPGGPVVALPVEASDVAETVARAWGRRVERISPYAGHPSDGAGLTAADGVATACLACALAARLGRIEHVLLDGRPAPSRLELAVPVAWNEIGQVMRRLAEQLGAMAEPPVDGLKVRHPRGWALVRPDALQPLVRLQVEAATLDDARDLLEQYAAYVRTASSPGP